MPTTQSKQENFNLPQSRHRKTGKAKKRSKGLYSTGKSSPPAGRNRQVRIIAIIIVLALAASAIAYLITKRSGTSAAEVTTPSGLKYVDVLEGTGPAAQNGQMLSVHYTGTLQNGFKFDSSVDKGVPYQFRLGIGNVIKGWDEGLLNMKVGGKRKLIVPPNLGYGPRGQPPNIPGNSTLLFDVELLSAK
ncbi:MAG TPA: FKBP-type peptidyl-prolyl cis-trans isomerase [Pyrinomonadaceae bacterium]|nr:FKBP-type peptidyl-prolyl cis-trans isomerase [Pyrinomonadaceae bacterium]